MLAPKSKPVDSKLKTITPKCDKKKILATIWAKKVPQSANILIPSLPLKVFGRRRMRLVQNRTEWANFMNLTNKKKRRQEFTWDLSTLKNKMKQRLSSISWAKSSPIVSRLPPKSHYQECSSSSSKPSKRVKGLLLAKAYIKMNQKRYHHKMILDWVITSMQVGWTRTKEILHKIKNYNSKRPKLQQMASMSKLHDKTMSLSPSHLLCLAMIVPLILFRRQLKSKPRQYFLLSSRRHSKIII